ncbi:KN motif and ankyrin repeat domain-containing protein 4-like isoform X2 [Denticeps clupeoides]|uniref:KN motif and ankyrin repeat domain-containing protein 4-like isoform X2 n=1 Tax=Denticeps clupeoides TaxID=299321 RepID=UPI0010A491C2|nr:KN motif and ankyrin repeat domain-containing protein 4-like isoform X2 [Denticeps clupeoides]
MDTKKVNGTSPKGNGAQRRPPCYSVETPYGFHLDLDFLKYVDDIEKGNTIRRVPIHRRHRVPNSTALSRNLSLPGYGYRPSQWSSIGSLWPKTRTIDSQQPYSFQGYEGMTVDNPELLGFTHGSLTNAEMEASIRAFDEQPLGLHVRPNLLRATSLPLTVLLRKHSETAEDPTSPRCSRIPQENGSTEDVFSDSSRVSTGTNGTIKRLTAALERIGELEEEIRVVPELKAQICILQEERERLLLKLNSNPNRSSKLEFSTGSNAHLQPDDWMSRELKHLEEKVQASSAQVNALSTPSLRDNAQTVMNHGITPKQCLKGQRDVLSVETLESRILSLEHKLHKSEQELDQARTMLQKLLEQSRQKDKRIEQLSRMERSDDQKNVWVKRKSPEDILEPSLDLEMTNSSLSAQQGADHEVTRPTSMVHHVNRVQELLKEQWECQRIREASMGTMGPLSPKMSSIQEQLLGLVDTLSMMIPAESSGADGQTFVQTSVRNLNVEKLTSLKTKVNVCDHPGGKDAVGEHHPAKDKREENQVGGTMGEAELHKESVGGTNSTKELEGHLASERVEETFMAACIYLKNHEDEMSNPSKDMVQALTVVFQHWFHLAAEEDSSAQCVELYLKQVKATTPTLLYFLVNMVDDEGNTALHYSMSHGNFSVSQVLLDSGVCDVDLRSKDGYSPLLLAAVTGPESPEKQGVVLQLLSLGDVNARLAPAGQTALHLAVRRGREDMVRLLLSAGADCNAQDQSESTALMNACELGCCDIITALLERPDCDVTLTDRDGRSALSIALQAPHPDAASLLRTHMTSRDLASFSHHK